jgi:hypothetical protein
VCSYAVYLFLFIALGALARLSIFTLNHFSVTITLYLLFAFNQVSMSFLWGVRSPLPYAMQLQRSI